MVPGFVVPVLLDLLEPFGLHKIDDFLHHLPGVCVQVLDIVLKGLNRIIANLFCFIIWTNIPH